MSSIPFVALRGGLPAGLRPVQSWPTAMLQSGILNPHLLSLLARVRHTNTLVIADSMFPSWPAVETVDLSLVYGVPTSPQVVAAILAHWKAGQAWMAEEFTQKNSAEVITEFRQALGPVPLQFEPHLEFKKRIPGTLGLIRTGEARIYTNILLESA